MQPMLQPVADPVPKALRSMLIHHECSELHLCTLKDRGPPIDAISEKHILGRIRGLSLNHD